MTDHGDGVVLDDDDCGWDWDISEVKNLNRLRAGCMTRSRKFILQASLE